jgi:Ser/Thr protein kinase RdoA (MazF antagonist)
MESRQVCRQLILARRALARRILPRYGLAPAPLRLVANLTSTHFRLDLTDRPKLLLRIIPIDGEVLTRLEATIAWLRALSLETDLAVPRPVPTLDGEWLPRLDDGSGSSVVVMIVEWIAGRFYHRRLTPRHLAAVGRLQGALHRHSQGFAAGTGTARSMPVGYADAVVAQDWLDKRQADLVLHAGKQIDDALLRLEANRDQAGLIHGDLHQWNVPHRGGVAAAIDFDDCGMSPYSLDMASSLAYLRCPSVGNHDHRQIYPAMVDAFPRGYASVRPLPADLDDQLRHGLAARQLSLLRWILCDWAAVDAQSWGRPTVAAALHELEVYVNGRAWSPREASALPKSA